MRVYRSNRVERLLDALVEVVAEPLPDPLAPEHIVVHSRGMAVWLQQRLASRLGVWAGGAFPFPRRFLHDCFRAVLGDDAVDAFEKRHLLWSIAAVLPDHLGDEAFVDLRRFLTDDPRGTKPLELAERIADRFDQYVVYRPDVVLGWEAGEGDDWQAILWRSLARSRGTATGAASPSHAAALARELVSRLREPSFDPGCLPERVCVFGVSSMPPFHVGVLAAIACHRPVHLFVPSPSREYWAEVRSHRELLRQARSPGLELLEEMPVPSLLRSLGMVGRDFQHILETEVDYEEPLEDLYVEPDAATMLGALQADLLHMRHPDLDAEKHVIEPSDDSIAIMVCHGPMREVEVLHDRILDLLAADETLQPRDIVVMMSDVETYAPLVEAVFERDAGREVDPTFVPYSVADRSVRGENPVIEAFHRVAALVGARVTASEVLDLLALEAVQARFELSPEDVDTMTQWVADSGIRWGIDADHRREHGQPATAQNTWRFGLDRLLLGYALPGDTRQTFAGVLPHDEIEGQSAALLGKLAELCARLFSVLQQLEDPRPVAQWPEALGMLIDHFLAREDHGAWEVEPLRAALEALVADAALVGHVDPVPLPAICDLIDARMEDDRPPRGFLAGGVTFCAMLPMRTIPFRVVCLLGMGDTQFPRSARTVGFDLMKQRPRAGDRSRRLDDRYLFLEALMAARDRVLITHVGQSIQDNSELPPSVVVSELLDHLAESFVVQGAPSQSSPEKALAVLEKRIVVRHPMQPFSPRYFGADADPRLFSYARTWREGAEALCNDNRERRGEHAPLLLRPLPALVRDDIPELTLPHLERFFRMPAAELLKRRLRVNLSDFSRDRSDREPMELGGLDEWKVGSSVIEHWLDDLPAARSLDLLRASGQLPHGVPGSCRHESLWRAADPIVQAVRPLLREGPAPNLRFDFVLDRTRLVGMLSNRHGGGLVSYQWAKLGAKTMLQAWIRHLVHRICNDAAGFTTVVARGERADSTTVLCLRPVTDPRAHLQDLLDLYWHGQTQPLLLFPRSSLAFARAFAAGKTLDAALDDARKEWAGHFNAEGREPHLSRLFADADVLQPGFRLFDEGEPGLDFPTVSVRVFAPILEHTEEA
jgi:exodeoxyribonuclease V gamma subunit